MRNVGKLSDGGLFSFDTRWSTPERNHISVMNAAGPLASGQPLINIRDFTREKSTTAVMNVAKPFARRQASFTISRATEETDLTSVLSVIKALIAAPHLLSTKEFTLVPNPTNADSAGKLLFITHPSLPIRKHTTRRNPSLKVGLLSTRGTTPGKSHTSAMCVEKSLFKRRVLQSMSKLILERDPIHLPSVGRPLPSGQFSRNIRESTLGRGPTNVMSVARPSDSSQILASTREFIVEVGPISVMSVGNCSDRTQLLFVIRLLTKEQESLW